LSFDALEAIVRDAFEGFAAPDQLFGQGKMEVQLSSDN
jgi:hypothetical protein